MWDKDWRRWGVSIIALALVVFSACPVRAQNKSPPPVDRSRAALSRGFAIAEMKPDMPLQPGDKVICTNPQRKEKAHVVEITITANSNRAELCPEGGRVSGFVYSMGADVKRHVITVDHAAPAVGDGVP